MQEEQMTTKQAKFTYVWENKPDLLQHCLRNPISKFPSGQKILQKSF